MRTLGRMEAAAGFVPAGEGAAGASAASFGRLGGGPPVRRSIGEGAALGPGGPLVVLLKPAPGASWFCAASRLVAALPPMNISLRIFARLRASPKRTR